VSTTPSPHQSRSFVGRLSHSSVGRVSGAFSRFLTGSTRVQATGRFLQRQLWAWPLIAAVLLGGIGWWIYRSVDESMRQQRINDLNAMVDACANAVRVWMHEQRINVDLVSADERLEPMVVELLRLAGEGPAAERQLVQAKAQEALRARLKQPIRQIGYVGFFVVSPSGLVIAADQDPPVGKALTGYRKEIFDKALKTIRWFPGRIGALCY
jgi:hypothetical protein